ncbi:hypothetical protein QUF99_11150 [Bacillus sp. DX4.1]|uniref:hypothetical protein n=1 Tax=Bacillus sp. DX4.1 TaxID=3055867 RepID=UPI0025A2C953|nr:hypothetical protein [Bacillus sp. DX4.1]MDM5187866.1 hypothetical protein [Bacillus sp. DX4.1]
MKQEIYREKSRIFISNQLQEETETIVYYSDGSFLIINSNEYTQNEEELINV